MSPRMVKLASKSLAKLLPSLNPLHESPQKGHPSRWRSFLPGVQCWVGQEFLCSYSCFPADLGPLGQESKVGRGPRVRLSCWTPPGTVESPPPLAELWLLQV